ncbi:hypothetical protein ACGFMM_24880 [Streptomyces sp. NPDC048604]|uniref:hypothetical protein n=1 Tax=Streptomyces sp. NPDC048604 TaxID=3365578 RepID=UPI0037246787
MSTVTLSQLRLLGQFRPESTAGPVDLCGNPQRLLAFVGLRGHVSRSGLAALLDGGELLPGWYEAWALLEREQLHALDALADRLTRQGSPAPALEAALASVRIEPLRGCAHRAAHRRRAR